MKKNKSSKILKNFEKFTKFRNGENKKKQTNKQKMTPEEYKLKNNSMKKGKRKPNNQKIPESPKNSQENTSSEKKQPLLIIKTVMKGKKIKKS